jgi:3-keto-L-gulonate-6-phosphate decarboxylase
MREKHLFQFNAKAIADAAALEAKYHRDRERYWKQEQADSLKIVQKTAKIVVKEVAVSGGTRPEVTLDYGDASAQIRMNEAFYKAANHRQAAERFETDAKVYGTQGERVYELETADVHYYRLGGGAREE